MTELAQQRGFDPVTAGQKAHALLYQALQQQAALLSYVDVFHIMGILFLVIIPLILLMRRTAGKLSVLHPRQNRNGNSHEHKIYPVVIHQEIHERDEEKGEEQDAFYSGHSRSPFPNFSLLVDGARAKLLS